MKFSVDDWDMFDEWTDEDGRERRPSVTMRGQTTGRAAAPQQPPPRRMTLGAVTSGIAREPSRILIYGVGGVGKSTFLSEAPKPIFIDTQDGTARLGVARFPRPKGWEDVLDALNELYTEEHSYQTLAIDLLDDLEALLWNYICARDDQENIEAYGYGKGYKVALAEWRVFLARLERLRREKGMAIGFVAHSMIRPFKNPEGEDFDRYTLQIHEQAAGLIRGWCDTVLFARHETLLKTDPKKKRTRGISTGARVIQTVETAAYYAKNRDNLPDTLPLDWAEFSAAVEAGSPASAAALRSEIAELVAQLDEETQGKVNASTAACGDDSTRLVRILNRLREKVQPQQQQQTESAT